MGLIYLYRKSEVYLFLAYKPKIHHRQVVVLEKAERIGEVLVATDPLSDIIIAQTKVIAMQKYHAIKTEYKGVVYDSKWEAQKAYELDMLQRAGKIKDLQRQVRFILQDGYVNNKGEKIRPISYIADFTYYDIKQNKMIVMDTKSPATRTAEYRIKKKLFEFRYPEYIFVEAMKN